MFRNTDQRKNEIRDQGPGVWMDLTTVTELSLIVKATYDHICGFTNYTT